MIKRKIALMLTVVALAAPVVQVSALEANNNAAVIKQVEVKDAYLELPAAEGNIVDISKIKDIVRIHVQERETQNPIEGQIILNISDETKIVNEIDGIKLTVKDIKKGERIKLYFNQSNGLTSLRSYLPTMCLAEKVVVMGETEEVCSSFFRITE